jgi:hypothetical protein
MINEKIENNLTMTEADYTRIIYNQEEINI